MADEGATIQYLVEVDLGDNGGPLLVRNKSELLEWARIEKEFWAWLGDRELQGFPNFQGMVNQVNSQINRLYSHAAQWDSKSESDKANELTSIEKVLHQYYKLRKVLHSSTPEAKFIDEFRQEVGLIEATAALATRCGYDLELKDTRQLRGAVAMVMFLEGRTPKVTRAISRSLKQISESYRTRYEQDLRAADSLQGRLEALMTEHSTQKEQGVADMAEAVKLAREQAEAQLAEAANRLSEFEEVYNTKLALDAPVKYWSGKRRTHRWWTVGFFAAFVVYLGAAVWAVNRLLPGTGLTNLSFWKDASLGVVGLTLAVLGILVALARILLRLAMSQLHLGNDADERVTMVSTYLALRQGGHATDSHMQVVLERLFAPASDGIVKDDLGPVTAIEAVKSAVSRR